MDDLAKIKSKFKKLGITQKEFAEKCGMVNTTIGRIFIKKTYPKTFIDFTEDFNKYGCLSANRDDDSDQ